MVDLRFVSGDEYGDIWFTNINIKLILSSLFALFHILIWLLVFQMKKYYVHYIPFCISFLFSLSGTRLLVSAQLCSHFFLYHSLIMFIVHFYFYFALLCVKTWPIRWVYWPMSHFLMIIQNNKFKEIVNWNLNYKQKRFRTFTTQSLQSKTIHVSKWQESKCCYMSTNCRRFTTWKNPCSILDTFSRFIWMFSPQAININLKMQALVHKYMWCDEMLWFKRIGKKHTLVLHKTSHSKHYLRKRYVIIENSCFILAVPHWWSYL